MGDKTAIRMSLEETKRKKEEIKNKLAATRAAEGKKPAASMVRPPRPTETTKVSFEEIINEINRIPENKPVAQSLSPEREKSSIKPLLERYSLCDMAIRGRPKPDKLEAETQVELPNEPKLKHAKEQVATRKTHEVESSPEYKDEEPKKQEYDAESVNRILDSVDFSDFFRKSTRLVERNLGKEEIENELKSDTDANIKSMLKLFDQKVCEEKSVTSLQWSPLYEELLLASYVGTSQSVNQGPRGLVCVWSLALNTRPEFVLNCQSPVTIASFNRFDHNLVIGGTYSGQIVVWDLRAKSQPIQRTPPMAESHSHPVYSLSIIGSQHANNIVSASNDGKVCVWSLNMFHTPTSSFEMKSRVKDVGCTCMAFPANETNVFYVGAEDGSIFQTQLHGSKLVDNGTETYEGHFGPITGLDIHPISENVFTDIAGNLLLSSSVDWTVKLWNLKAGKQPIMSLDAYEDYVFDVKWNPHHPGMFAVIDGSGNLDFWNLNKNTETPDIRYKTGNKVLNHLAWATESTRIATGNCDGELNLYKLDKEYAYGTAEDWSQMESLITNE